MPEQILQSLHHQQILHAINPINTSKLNLFCHKVHVFRDQRGCDMLHSVFGNSWLLLDRLGSCQGEAVGPKLYRIFSNRINKMEPLCYTISITVAVFGTLRRS